jgi:hypothetical protein
MALCNNLRAFGIFCGHLVYAFSGFGMFLPRKIWQQVECNENLTML